MPFYIYALIACIVLCAGVIQSVAGFGFGILVMIFLPRLLLYTEASVLSTMLSMLTSLLLAVTMLRRVHWRNLVFPLIGSAVMTVVAVTFVKSQRNDTLLLLLGIALVVIGIYFFFFSSKIRIRPTWYAGLIAGSLSGFLGGTFAIAGPPAAIYFMQSEEKSERYLATLSAYFVFSDSISIVSKISAGFATGNVWRGFAVGVCFLALGLMLGKGLRGRISPMVLKKIVYGLMTVSGIVNIVTVLTK